MVKIFLTGATGYLGGEALYQLSHLHDQHEIAALVRDEAKCVQLRSSYPHVRIVRGTLDDEDTIEKEARASDVVLHLAAIGHAASAHAIARGLSYTDRKNPGHWIQMSGASLYSCFDIAEGTYGEARSNQYDDVKDIDEIQRIIRDSPNRVVEQLVLAQDPSKIKTALLPGPLIYGVARGPGNTRSMQAEAVARYTLEHGKGFQIGAGQSAWSYIHVSDISALLVKLVEAAAQGKEGVWNQKGIYHAESGKISFGDLGRRVAVEAYRMKLVASPDVTLTVPPNDAESVTSRAEVILATTAITHASRGRFAFGWKPKEPKLEDLIPEIVRAEADLLGKKAV